MIVYYLARIAIREAIKRRAGAARNSFSDAVIFVEYFTDIAVF